MGKTVRRKKTEPPQTPAIPEALSVAISRALNSHGAEIFEELDNSFGLYVPPKDEPVMALLCAMANHIFGANSWQYASALTRYGNNCSNQEAAERSFRDAIKIFERHSDLPSDARYSWALYHLAELSNKQGRHDEALELCNRVIRFEAKSGHVELTRGDEYGMYELMGCALAGTAVRK